MFIIFMQSLIFLNKILSQKTFSPQNVQIILDDSEDFFCSCSECGSEEDDSEVFVWHPKRKF